MQRREGILRLEGAPCQRLLRGREPCGPQKERVIECVQLTKDYCGGKNEVLRKMCMYNKGVLIICIPEELLEAKCQC